MNLTRREAVIKMAVLMGASVVGPRLWGANVGTSSATDANSSVTFDAGDLALLDEIGDTIIPATDVPGAKAVGIGAFVAMMVRDCYGAANQATFKAGLRKIETAHAARFGGNFLTGSAADRTALLNDLDREQKVFTAERRRTAAPLAAGAEEEFHYFRMMKELTILGYFSSEIGCTKALRFMEVPGRFDGAAPYKKGDRAWFN